jgi:hypothetical protein
VQTIHQLLFSPGYETLLIGILDAQDELPASLAGEQVIV